MTLGLRFRLWRGRRLRGLTRLDRLGLERIRGIAGLLCTRYQPLNSILGVSACSWNAGNNRVSAVNRAVPLHGAVVHLPPAGIALAFRDGFSGLDTDNNRGNENGMTSRNLFQNAALSFFFQAVEGFLIVHRAPFPQSTRGAFQP